MRTESLKKVDSEIKYRRGRLLWGQPPQIVIAIMDKECPRCGKSTQDDMGLDLGYEYGVVFGGICFSCGWSFGVNG